MSVDTLALQYIQASNKRPTEASLTLCPQPSAICQLQRVPGTGLGARLTTGLGGAFLEDDTWKPGG